MIPVPKSRCGKLRHNVNWACQRLRYASQFTFRLRYYGHDALLPDGEYAARRSVAGQDEVRPMRTGVTHALCLAVRVESGTIASLMTGHECRRALHGAENTLVGGLSTTAYSVMPSTGTLVNAGRARTCRAHLIADETDSHTTDAGAGLPSLHIERNVRTSAC
jgi:hypothetical protein